MAASSFEHDDDDMFADTRMSFWDHIEELRKHMWRAIIGFVVALVLSFFVGEPVLEFIAAPVEKQLMEFYKERNAKALKKADDKLKQGALDLNEANEWKDTKIRLTEEQLQKLASALGIKGEVPPLEQPLELTAGIRPVEIDIMTGTVHHLTTPPPSLRTFTVLEAFVVYFKVCIFCGIVVGSPWIFYQLWSFVGAGLYPHEKRYVTKFLPVSLGLFLAGVALCEFVVLPTAIHYLLSFNEWLGFEPELRLTDWLTFALIMPLSFGVAFQLPLVMLFLYRIGIVPLETYTGHRRIAYFVIACAYIIIGASPDAVSMMLLTVPLWGLYELGIVLCKMSPHAPEDLDIDSPESGEMVEV